MTEFKSGNRSLIILAVSVMVILAIFVVLLLLRDDPNELTYNQFEFRYVNGFWQTEWQRQEQRYILDFTFNPKQVEDIPVEGTTDIRFESETVYIAVDPTEERTPETAQLTLAAVQLTRKLTDPFYRNIIAACTRNETEACLDRPIITCDNTNSSVLYLKQADEAKIVLDGNCVTIQGNGDGIVKAADKALFQWLGIIS